MVSHSYPTKLLNSWLGVFHTLYRTIGPGGSFGLRVFWRFVVLFVRLVLVAGFGVWSPLVALSGFGVWSPLVAFSGFGGLGAFKPNDPHRDAI